MLTWHHTEFGRRSDCLSYSIMRKGYDGCLLLDTEWNVLAECPSIAAAQRRAEQIETQKETGADSPARYKAG